jgi:hypothetical protein
MDLSGLVAAGGQAAGLRAWMCLKRGAAGYGVPAGPTWGLEKDSLESRIDGHFVGFFPVRYGQGSVANTFAPNVDNLAQVQPLIVLKCHRSSSGVRPGSASHDELQAVDKRSACM